MHSDDTPAVRYCHTEKGANVCVCNLMCKILPQRICVELQNLRPGVLVRDVLIRVFLVGGILIGDVLISGIWSGVF